MFLAIAREESRLKRVSYDCFAVIMICMDSNGKSAAKATSNPACKTREWVLNMEGVSRYSFGKGRDIRWMKSKNSKKN